MVKYEEYFDVLASNAGKYPIVGFERGAAMYACRDDESMLFKFRGDDVNHPKKAILYRYDYVEGEQTRFVIICGNYEVSINKKENGYGGISIRNTIYDSPNGDTIISLGFCDDHFYLLKLKEKAEEMHRTGLIESSEEDIKACDWNLEIVFDEMLHAIQITWDDEEWRRDSEMIFNFLKPALALAIMDTRMKWEEYNRNWEKYWEGQLAIIDVKTAKLKKEREDILNGSYSIYKKTREILEAQRQVDGSKKK